MAEDNAVYLKWSERLRRERPKGKQETTVEFLRKAAQAHRMRADFNVKTFQGKSSAFGVAWEYFRMGRRPISPALEERACELGVRLEHLGITIGTVIHNVNLKESQCDEMINFIRSTLLERKVVFFRDQHITIDEQLAFAHRFGPLDAFPFGDHVDGHPKVLRIAGIGTQAANAWHTDVTWMEEPSMGSILHMVEVPEVGGDTSFSDSHAAFLGLPEQLKKNIENVYAVHDYRGFLAGVRARGISEDTIAGLKSEVPFGVVHPLIRTHPETGKQALYLNGGFMRHDSLHTAEGPWNPERSKRVVDFLLQQHAKPEYQCRFRWEKGSIAFWDNRACQHCATADYYPNVRVGHRVTISGDRPYYDPSAVPVAVTVHTPSAKL